MKITILTGPFLCLPPYAIGAVEKLWYSIGTYLISEGEEIIFVSKKPIGENHKKNNIYVPGYDRTGSWFKDFILDFVYSWRALKMMPKSDIIILNSQWSPILARVFKRKYKKSIYSVERFPKRQLGIYKKLGNIDYFRCCSTAVYNELVRQNNELKSMAFIVPNFIDTSIFHNDISRKLSKNITVVYSGRIHKEKGIDILVKAVEFLYKKDNIRVDLMIIGAYDKERGGSGEEYINYVRKISNNINIKWIPPIYDSVKLAEEIRKGDIFCYPSVAEKGETFGVAPLEAMGLGLPTIVSDLQCFKEFVNNGENALIFNHNDKNVIEQLAYKIKDIIESPELFHKLSIEGAKTAKKFSIEEISKVYYSKFEELLNGKNIR